MEAVRKRLLECGLSGVGFIKQYDLAQRLEKFVKEVWNKNLLMGQGIGNDYKSILKNVINQLEKNNQNLIGKRWVKLLLVNSIIHNSSPKIINDEFAHFLGTLCEQLPSKTKNIQISKLSKIPQSKSFIDKFSSGLSKIGSIMKLDYLNDTQEQFRKNNIILHVQKQNNLTLADVSQKILTEFNAYLRKKLLNYKFFLRARQNHQRRQSICIQSDKDLAQLRGYAWKIINLFTHYISIIGIYKKIAFIQAQLINPLIIVIFNMLCQDCLILYPYISKLIKWESLSIKKKYDRIIAECGNVVWGKDIKRLRLVELSRDVMLVDVGNLLAELSKINQMIAYMFCCKTHCRYIHIVIPQNHFLKTSNPELDEIHKILDDVMMIGQKQQRLKVKQTKMSLKFDQSISKIVSKLDTMQNIKQTQSVQNRNQEVMAENI